MVGKVWTFYEDVGVKNKKYEKIYYDEKNYDHWMLKMFDVLFD